MPLGLLAAAALAAATPPGGVLPDEQAAYEKELAAKARLADQTYRGWCADTSVQVVSTTPWKFPDLPDTVTWKVRVRVAGCGHNSLENLNVARTGGAAPWMMNFGLPGQTLAHMGMQRDTVRVASQTARADFRGCQDTTLSDVYVTARPGGIDVYPPGTPVTYRRGRPAVSLTDNFRLLVDKLDLSTAWEEVWPFEVCGHDRTLGVVFIPYKEGTVTEYVFLPLWQMVEKHGAGSLPQIAPPVSDEETDGVPLGS